MVQKQASITYILYNFELQFDVVVSFLISVVAFYQSLAFYVANENRQKTRETTVHLEKQAEKNMVKMHHGTLLVKRTAKEIWHG